MPTLAPVAQVPLWLTVLVLSRDIAIVLTVAIVNLAVSHRTFRPSLLGKAATVIYVITGVVTLYANYQGSGLALVQMCVYLSLAITLLSGFEYLYRMSRGDA
jgi:phosphatidylglycerophosphate synthase